MARVFISHASEDSELADEVHGWLTHDGHEVFLDYHPDEGIAVGDAWEQRLYERLRWRTRWSAW
jgi:TIR domain